MSMMKGLKNRPEFSVRSIATAIWKRKLLTATVTVVLMAASAAGIYRIPPVYSTECVILVQSQRIPEKYVTATVSPDLQERLDNLRKQILSYSRLVQIVQK